jgi:hypothetical protein
MDCAQVRAVRSGFLNMEALVQSQGSHCEICCALSAGQASSPSSMALQLSGLSWYSRPICGHSTKALSLTLRQEYKNKHCI